MQTKKSYSLSVTVVRNKSPDIQPLGPPGSSGSRFTISVIYAAAVLGMEAEIVQVETHLTSGMVRFFLVGLPSRAVAESRDRVEAAIKSTGYAYPLGRITVNLAPAIVHKEGNGYDLPIAIGLLAMSKQISSEKLTSSLMMAELSLDGHLRPVHGVLAMAFEAKKAGLSFLVVARENAHEAALVPGIQVAAFGHLSELILWLNGIKELDQNTGLNDYNGKQKVEVPLDYAQVKGHSLAKRGLEISAAGGHNVVLIGPPGSGKTMMARRFSSILPPLTKQEALEVLRVQSAAALLRADQILKVDRPLRSPHHSASRSQLLGGGRLLKPGDLSLAHNGILLLDEWPEFSKNVLESLRRPLEEGFVDLSWGNRTIRYPSKITLLATMNPSAKGTWYDPARVESPSLHEMKRYVSRISGPLWDRIELQIEVTSQELSFWNGTTQESSEEIAGRVAEARNRMTHRFAHRPLIHTNAQMDASELDRSCTISSGGEQLMKHAVEKLSLSTRAYVQILRVSRTIADLEGVPQVSAHHLAEAIQFRSLDRLKGVL